MYRAANNSTKEAYFGKTWNSVQYFGLLCFALLLLGMPQPTRAQSAADEYQVKAAFLFHFAQFLTWPSDSLNAGHSSLSLCIFDDEPRRQEVWPPMDRVDGRTVAIRDRIPKSHNRPCGGGCIDQNLAGKDPSGD